MDRPRIRVDGAVPRDASVVPVERDPITGRAGGFDRDRKGRRQESRPSDPGPGPAVPPSRPISPRPPGRLPGGRRTWMVVGAAAVTAAIIVVAAVVVGGRGGASTDDAAGQASGSAISGGPTSQASVSGALSSDSGTLPSDSGVVSSVGTASGTSGMSAGGSLTGGPGTVPTVSPFLDPARVGGYQLTQHPLVDSFGGEPRPTQGMTFLAGAAMCRAGICTLPYAWGQFAVAAPGMSNQWTEDSGRGSGCEPIVYAVELTLDPTDGSYRGHFSMVPKADWSKQGGMSCRASHREVDLVLTPAVAPDLDAMAIDTPPTLHPGKIRGYQGSASGGSPESSGEAKASCDRGVCRLTCSVCGGVSAVVEAAAPAWLVKGTRSYSEACGEALADLRLTRADDGSYSGTATLTYLEKDGKPGCSSPPASFSMSLTPLT